MHLAVGMTLEWPRKYTPSSKTTHLMATILWQTLHSLMEAMILKDASVHLSNRVKHCKGQQ